MKIRRVGAEMFHETDGLTDMTEISRFSQFCEDVEKRHRFFAIGVQKRTPERWDR